MARNKFHYHVIRDNGYEEEFTVEVPTKAQAIRAARYQAIRESNERGWPLYGNRNEGYEVVPNRGPLVTYNWQRCSQRPCTAVREDSPSLEDTSPFPMP